MTGQDFQGHLRCCRAHSLSNEQGHTSQHPPICHFLLSQAPILPVHQTEAAAEGPAGPLYVGLCLSTQQARHQEMGISAGQTRTKPMLWSPDVGQSCFRKDLAVESDQQKTQMGRGQIGIRRGWTLPSCVCAWPRHH